MAVKPLYEKTDQPHRPLRAESTHKDLNEKNEINHTCSVGLNKKKKKNLTLAPRLTQHKLGTRNIPGK